MRTGGDDIAQALALIGVKPVWDMASRRVTGYEIVPIAKLGRPRVDVTLRISGFFRDAFPEQIALFDKAVRAVGALDEDAEDNPIAARMRIEQARLVADGADEKTAERRAGYRVFGSKPGAYGAGLQALIDENGWAGRNDLAEAWLVWGGYAYGAGEEGQAERGLLEERLRSVQAVVQNQDNREHDLLDSDDYYQFEGGMAATVESLSGAMPSVYHNDHSRPEKPVIRALEEELSRVVRGRAANPKWIAGVMRHGYKGRQKLRPLSTICLPLRRPPARLETIISRRSIRLISLTSRCMISWPRKPGSTCRDGSETQRCHRAWFLDASLQLCAVRAGNIEFKSSKIESGKGGKWLRNRKNFFR